MSDQHVEGHSAMTQHAALYATVSPQLDTKPSANDTTKPSFQCTHLQSCQPMHSTAFQTQPEYALPNAQGNDHIRCNLHVHTSCHQTHAMTDVIQTDVQRNQTAQVLPNAGVCHCLREQTTDGFMTPLQHQHPCHIFDDQTRATQILLHYDIFTKEPKQAISPRIDISPNSPAVTLTLTNGHVTPFGPCDSDNPQSKEFIRKDQDMPVQCGLKCQPSAQVNQMPVANEDSKHRHEGVPDPHPLPLDREKSRTATNQNKRPFPHAQNSELVQMPSEASQQHTPSTFKSIFPPTENIDSQLRLSKEMLQVVQSQEFLPPSKKQKTCQQTPLQIRTFHQDQKLPVIMAAYGSQHKLNPDMLRTKGCLAHFTQDDLIGPRLLHPAEIAMIHGVTGRFLP